MNYFKFGDINSKDFNVFISGEHTFISPERDVDTVEIAGRDGTLTLDNGRFRNVKVEYPCLIAYDFRKNYDGFRAAMLSKRGNQKLADSYDKDHYRKARLLGSFDPEMTQLNRHGTFKISFDCDPRRFLKSGDKVFSLTSETVLKNPTLYPAKPLIRAYGVGSLTIGDITLQVASAVEYTDIDCELQEAYKGSLNCNNSIILENGSFPVLDAGNNEISFTGFSQVDITPRWYTV